MQKTILGIETSCDETGAAIVTSEHAILADVVATQFHVHAAFNGVVPKLAARSHEEALPIVVAQAIQRAGSSSSSDNSSGRSESNSNVSHDKGITNGAQRDILDDIAINMDNVNGAFDNDGGDNDKEV